MSKGVSGMPIDLVCSEQAIPEFPDLLFGTTTEGSMYFDASMYIEKTENQNKVDDFIECCKTQINHLLSSYSIEFDNAFHYNKEGHLLIINDLTYLFLSFVEPDFLCYIFERIHELFKNGFCVSDTYLFKVTPKRLPAEIIKEMTDGM